MNHNSCEPQLVVLLGYTVKTTALAQLPLFRHKGTMSVRLTPCARLVLSLLPTSR